jgi:molybdopterin-containing oxidoreductase family iron-sulfur binding subunit
MSRHDHHDHPDSDTPMVATPLQPGDYWSTLSEYDRDAEYVSRLGEEFYPDAKPENAYNPLDENALLTPMHRRTFLKLSGFAAVLASIQGCERPVEKILPYVHKPEEILPGVANYYASTCTECAAACGLLVKAREGRPIKLEGNPEHPMNRGALCTRGQASILKLYDPDRQKWPARVARRGAAGFAFVESFRLADADAAVVNAILAAKGDVVLLTPTITGPANERLLAEFVAHGNGRFRHVTYDVFGDGLVREAHRVAFGEAVLPRLRWDRAEVVVLLGGDPLAQSYSTVETQAGFAARRKPGENMSQVFAFEPAPTLSGMAADYRLPVRPEHLLPLGLAIAHELIVVQGRTEWAGNAQVLQWLAPHDPATVAKATGIPAAEITRVAKALAAKPGRSIVHATGGAARTADALNLQLLATFLNHALGNYGSTVDITVSPSRQSAGSNAAMLQLIADMRAGKVDVLIVSGVNPVYTLPPDAGFAEGLARVGTVVSLNLHPDETSALADVMIPTVHGLESWGDAEPQAGLYSIQQPIIRTLFGEVAADGSYMTRSWQESLMAFLRGIGSKAFERPLSEAELLALAAAEGVENPADLPADKIAPRQLGWYDYLRETWRIKIYESGQYAATSFDNFWIGVVREGVLDTIGAERRDAAGRAPAIQAAALAAIRPAAASSAKLVTVTAPTIVHGDGSTMSNPQLLELADPVSKVCWDNYASIAPVTAEELRLKEGQFVTVTAAGRSIRVPVWIQPGVHPGVVSVNLGWGRNTYGGVGDGLGANAFALQQVAGGMVISSGLEATIARAEGSTRLANIQGHNYLFSPTYAGLKTNKRKTTDKDRELAMRGDVNEAGEPVYARPIVGETTLKEWQADPFHGYPNALEPHRNAPDTIWEATHKYVGHHWGMSVDLNACNGCGACVIACSIENNVPVVGKEEVVKGREMHWIRIDRYYRGDKANPDFVHMPVMCQHCDNAPCETVCPVIATMHNDEGLNVMTYNRCVGTRYCANNCPYKVRRFNFWQYTDFRTGPYGDGPEGERKTARKRVAPLELVLNPDVTTRTRGVMEKCTFCTSRIRAAKDKARENGTKISDEDLQTACQQTCPAKAITFGDRNNPGAKVAADWKDPRGYGLLADLNTDPSVRYMALVRNRDEASPYRTKYQSNRLKYGSHNSKEPAEGGAHSH